MTLNDLKIKPRRRSDAVTAKRKAPSTPSINLAAILNSPVVAVEKAATSIMINDNFFMLVNASGQAIWGTA